MAATTHPAANTGSVVYMNGAMFFKIFFFGAQKKKKPVGKLVLKKREEKV